MSNNWKPTTWGEIATLEYGKGLLGYENANGDFPVYGTNGKIGWHTEPLFDNAGVIIGRKGAYRGVHYSKTPFFVIDTAFYLKPKTEIDLRWAYYQLLTQDINSMDSGSAIPSTSRPDFYALPLLLPSLTEQHAIAGILGALDDKIELNRRMNRTLESMARAVFRQWFVEGEEVENWKVGKLGDVMTNFDSKRVPVANRERAQRQGKYPYYGAASVMDYVDDYLFDGIYVLMGEDGSVVDDEGHPVIQYVWGKIWVNNHAHVLQGANGICNEHLYLFLKDVNILPYITGAVQPKINQANMNSIPFPLPPMELRKKFEEFVSPLFAKIRANDEESRTLASLRDSLLPKLIRGEVRVK